MTMKTKSTIFTACAAVLFGLTSCQKMLTTESTIVMFEQDHELNESTDTLYSVVGILQKIQKIADRTVLFGELRGDLTSLNEYASSDLSEISNFSVSKENKYNNALDYYAVINNCNYYLAKADTSYKKNKHYIFRDEYGVVLGYRAWAYIKLAEAYGKVPFVTEPIVNGAMADASLYPLLDIKEISKRLIPDLEPFVDIEQPKYGTMGDFNSADFFLPTRLILAELCLWAGDGYYVKAAKYLHDYVSSVDRHVYTNLHHVWWRTRYFVSTDDSYSSLFGQSRAEQIISFIPMESQEFMGVTSELDDIYTSTKDNYYYFKATASPALRSLAASQAFCFVEYDPLPNEYYVSPEEMPDQLTKGDLRLYSVLDVDDDIADEKLASTFNTRKQILRKIDPLRICVFRKDLVYLRLAEALNCAGMPEAAFAVLKYGLCEDYVMEYVSKEERAMAEPNKLLDFSRNYFYQYAYSPTQGGVNSRSNTQGIHSRGSGEAQLDTTYVLKCHPDTLSARYLAMSDADKSAYLDSVRSEQQIEVEEYLINELALETSFEGNRFGDLVRFSMHRAEKNGGYTDNAFVAERVAKRNGALDQALYDKLKGDGTGYNKDWYLQLP